MHCNKEMAGLKIQYIFRCVIREPKNLFFHLRGIQKQILPFLFSLFFILNDSERCKEIKKRQGEKPEDQELYIVLLLFPHVLDLLSHSSPGNKKKKKTIHKSGKYNPKISYILGWMMLLTYI